MIPLNSIKRCRIVLLVIASVSVAGCSSKTGECKNCADTTFAPTATIRMVDKTTKQDLFFGPGAKYSTATLRISHVENGRVDTVPAEIKVDTANHLLNFRLLYLNHVDTVAIQLGVLKPQLLYLETGILNNCCTKVIVTSATLSGSLIFKAPDDPKKQATTPNVVTVPF